MSVVWAMLLVIIDLIAFTITGIDSFDVSLEKQEVFVKGSAGYDTVLENIKKTGKEVRSGEVIH